MTDESYSSLHSQWMEEQERARKLIRSCRAFAKRNAVDLRMKYPAVGPQPLIEITDLFADRPGTGAGTKVMQKLCRDADAAGFNLIAHPMSGRNVGFYGRFGFVQRDLDGALVRMVAKKVEEARGLRHYLAIVEAERR